jgi:5-(aminomethyl)-3-furanmethanol phosphate kinase
MPFYVLKLGGSLMNVARELVSTLLGLTAEGYSFLIVPGGGPMADLIRDLFSRHGISQEAAHWMAVLAMEQYAYFLADGTGAKLTRKVQRSDGLEILLPYQALLDDDRGLGHCWDYTSDSIAALVSIRLDAPLIKATDVDGVILDGRVVEEIRASELIGRETCIDQGALHLLKGRSCRVLCGLDPARFASMMRAGEGGTVIAG